MNRSGVFRAPAQRLLVIAFVLAIPTVLQAQVAPWHRVDEARRQQASMRVGGTVSRLRWDMDAGELLFTTSARRMMYDLDEHLLIGTDDDDRLPTRDAPARHPPRRGRQHQEEPSPDGAWTAEVVDWNVQLVPTGEGDPIVLTTYGHRKFRYGTADWVYGEELDQVSGMWWSSDSRHLAFYEFDERPVRDFHLVTGLTGIITRIATEGYPKAGDPNPVANLLVHDLDTATTTRIDVGDDPDQYVYDVRFSPDGSLLLYNRTNRLQNVLELVAADPVTGASRVVVREEQATWQENHPEIHFLSDGHRFVWGTERTGWKHYELRDLDGALHATITSGAFPDLSIELIDEDAGMLFYLAASGPNPINPHLHRVGLDGTGQTRLTRVGAHHVVHLSPGGSWFLDTAQAVAVPPVTTLHRTDRLEPLAILSESLFDGFDAHGLSPPELFTCLAADGTTDLYGILWKPESFDPSRSYPLVIDVYGGPLSRTVRNTFQPRTSMTALGFLVARIDNRGTPGRGKAFESATYRRLGQVDLDDQAAAVQFLASRPYVDGDRVGIIGGSYGGYLAAMAMLRRPDVFHAGVAMSAVTDWLNYDTIYTERFMQRPEDNPEGYEQGSCMTHAASLAGDLLIMHGMVDDNVHPNNAWQLVKALRRVERDFDLEFYPERGHGLGRHAHRTAWTWLWKRLVRGPPGD